MAFGIVNDMLVNLVREHTAKRNNETYLSRMSEMT